MKKHYTTQGLEKEKKFGERIGRAAGEEIGRKSGVKIGEHKKKIEVIKKMLNDNLEIKIIKKYTNATDEEIEEAKISKN